MPAPTSTRCSPCSTPSRCRAGPPRPSRCCGAGSPAPRSTCGLGTPPWSAPRRTSRGSWPRPACPRGSRSGPTPCSAPWPRRGRAAPAAGRSGAPARGGGIDAIVDIVGTCAALEVLGVDEVRCSPIAVGLGVVRAAHGVIPNPAPAVVELLRGAPTRGVDLPVELTTPTGAALVAGLAGGFGPLPAMTVAATGYGAGSREIDGRPNLTQVVLGHLLESAPADGQPVVLLEANVDDVTGEVLAHAVAALLDAGAHDAWITPVVGKKGRPAHQVSTLCDPALVAQVRGVLADETGTLGVRGQTLERWPSARRQERVVVDDLSVRVKVSPGRVKAEFDDAARVARRTDRPVRDVLAEAEGAWRAEGPAQPVDDGRASVTSIHAREQAAHPSGHHHDHPHPPAGEPDPDEVPPA
ncbi:MAG: LarC family nickel insertion protein [Acidimicrobiales bacterium]